MEFGNSVHIYVISLMLYTEFSILFICLFFLLKIYKLARQETFLHLTDATDAMGFLFNATVNKKGEKVPNNSRQLTKQTHGKFKKHFRARITRLSKHTSVPTR